MNKILKITMIAAFMMSSQFFFAQQTTVDQQDVRINEGHKKIKDRITALQNEQQQVRSDASLSKPTPKSEEMITDKIAGIKKEQERLEAKDRKLSDLENNLSLRKEKFRKLQANLEAEYQKNVHTTDPATLKRIAEMKDNASSAQGDVYKQEGEIDAIINTP